MTEELISVIDLAKLRGKHKAYIFKVLKRLKIETIKEKSSEAKGQKISYINKNDYELLKNHFVLMDQIPMKIRT
jgi:hypothetical protein